MPTKIEKNAQIIDFLIELIIPCYAFTPIILISQDGVGSGHHVLRASPSYLLLLFLEIVTC